MHEYDPQLSTRPRQQQTAVHVPCVLGMLILSQSCAIRDGASQRINCVFHLGVNEVNQCNYFTNHHHQTVCVHSRWLRSNCAVFC